MQIDKALWNRFQASNAKSRKKSATLRAVAEHVRTTRSARALAKGGDVLGRISPAEKLERQRRVAAVRREVQSTAAIRAALILSIDVAKQAGFTVKTSSARNGGVSSVYAELNGKRVRISDHRLPQTAKREAQSDAHGGASAFAGEIIIEGAMTATRIRRLLTLAIAGRLL